MSSWYLPLTREREGESDNIALMKVPWDDELDVFEFDDGLSGVLADLGFGYNLSMKLFRKSKLFLLFLFIFVLRVVLTAERWREQAHLTQLIFTVARFDG